MSDVNYSEVLFQSIDQIVEERLKQVQYDRTILCKVIEAYPDDNKYWVNCEGLKLQVQSIDPKKTYSKDSMVYVLMPEGNYENVKVIIGGYNDKDIEKKVFNNSYDDFIPNQTFKFDNPITFQLSDINTSKEIASDNYIPIQYDQEYDYVGVEWAMTTYSLFDAGINSGKYTLEIVFYNAKNEPIISYPIESSSIYGNPYSLSEEFKQYNLFPYSEKLNNCNSFKIRLYQGIQKDNNPEEIIDKFNDEAQKFSITLNYLHLSVGYSKAKFAENQTLNLKKGNSLNYKTNDSNLKRTLYLDWRVKDKEANEQIFNYNNLKYSNLINNARIYWLKYHENIGYKSTQIIKDYTNIDGLYNWKIISMDSFEYNLKIDTDYQIDQYKVFIVYDSKNAETEDDSDTLTNYKFTNTIIFENLDIAAIQPGSSNSDNNSNDLKFTLNEGNTGVYNVYGLDGRMSDSSKGGPYTITASLFDSLQDKISKVEWFFPPLNTMIIDDRSTDWGLSINEKLTVQYKIKNRYYPSATQNTIRCKVTMSTGEIRNGSISFEFGQLGNQGTNYAFNIDFIGKNYLTNGENEEIQVKATLSNQNGEEVLLEDFINNLEWSWLFTTDGKVIDKDSTTEITSLSNIVCSKYQNNIVKLYLNNSFEMSEYNYSILQAKLKGYNTGDGIKADLTSYLCIPVAAADTDQIKPRSIQGATTIVYDSLGTSTSHSTEYYEVINDTNNYIDELEWNLSSQIAGYTGFPDLGKYQKKEEDSDKTITKYKIKPSSYVPLKTPPVSIIAKKNDSVIWNQPILIIQNTWFNETINEWNGVLKINEEDGSILSPLLIAGTKGSNNLFTGVTVGQLDTGSTTTNRTVNGIYGFKEGKARFWLNQDAEFYIGTGKDKNLYFDNNGNFTIAAKSFNLETTDQNLILSSTSGEFYISDGTNYLQFQKEIKDGETITRNSIFKIKANEFEFDNAGYNGFSMRVGKEGFYTGTENEYISFEKQLKEDGSQDYYRTLKIKAKNFELITDHITLSSSEHYLLIKKSVDENSDRVRAGYIRTEGSNKIYGLDIYGGALRVYTKESTTNPALWIQDSNIYIKGRITNQYATNPTTWMTMGNPDKNSGEDRGPAFRMYYTTELTSTSIFKIWPGHVDGDYHHIVISGYKGLGFSPYVKPNSGNGYSTYLDVTTTGGDMSEKWVLYNSHRFSGDVRTKNSLAICRSDDNYETYDLHLWSDDSNNGVVDAPSGNLSLRSKNSSFITGTTTGGTLHGTWYYGTLSGGNITASALNLSADGSYSVYTTVGNTTAVKGVSGAILMAGSSTKLEVNSSGGKLYGTWDIDTITSPRTIDITSTQYNITLRPSSSGHGWLYGNWYIDQDYNNSGSAVTSDVNKKNSILDIENRYEVFFNALHPVTFKYNNGNSDRIHVGYIAQEVGNALGKANLTTQEFAGLVITTENVGDFSNTWMLRYEEFIALNTWQIQKLKTRVTELESEIKEIKQRYEI